jgi:hypothetical protein
MLKRIVAGLLVAAALTLAGSPAAQAAGCLSDGQTRQAVANGQALSLNTFLGAILAAVGGGQPAGARLCDGGGRLVWMVQVLTGGGQQQTVYCDALSGAISVR